MRKQTFYKFETLRVQNFQKLIVSDLCEMKKKASLVLSVVGTQAARANLVPNLPAQESGCSLRMFAKDLMGRNVFPTGVTAEGSRGCLSLSIWPKNPACFHLLCGIQTQEYLMNRRPC